MKILCAIDSLHGGDAETSLVDMVPVLRERNVHLSLVTLLTNGMVELYSWAIAQARR